MPFDDPSASLKGVEDGSFHGIPKVVIRFERLKSPPNSSWRMPRFTPEGRTHHCGMNLNRGPIQNSCYDELHSRKRDPRGRVRSFS